MIRRDGIKDVRANALDKLTESKKKSKIYTTKIVDQILLDAKKGKEPDTGPFYHGKLGYKDSGIIFELTDYEKSEMEKCSEDVIYFVEKYCKFKNDKGYTTVKLRPFQDDILHLLGDEVYDEEIDEIKPKNRRVILMCSRQTGKCVTGDTKVSIINNSKSYSIPMYKLYYENLDTITLLDILIYYCNKFNIYHIFDRLIFKLEQKKFGNSFLDKIIDSIKIKFNVKSNNQINKTKFIHRTIPFEVWKLTLENGYVLYCADNHLLYVNDEWKFVKDLSTSDYICTDIGLSKIKSIYNTKKLQYMYDLELD